MINDLNEPGELSVDERLKLLRKTRRRYLLNYLRTADEHVTVDELTGHIMTVENQEREGRLPDDHRRTIKIALHHTHLPVLAEHGAVKYDQRNGTVTLSDGPEITVLLDMISDRF